MGAFLDKPVTDKYSGDDENHKLKCGYSTMQGWRMHQEDAFNCILNFDEDASLFAVYDGHGGGEVAEYCSAKLPDFIKNFELYKSGDYENALIESFMAFDKTLCTPEVIEELKKFIQPSKLPDELDEGDESDIEENVDNLYAEATMPIEEVIEKYKRQKQNEPDSSKDVKCEASCSSSEAACSSGNFKKDDYEENNEADGVSSSSSEAFKCRKVDSNGIEDDAERSLPDSSSAKEADAKVSDVSQNGLAPEGPSQENSIMTNKAKGKAILKKVEKVLNKELGRPIRSITSSELYEKLLKYVPDSDCDEDDSEEDDESYEGPKEDSSDENEETTNPQVKESDEDSAVESEEEEEEDENDEKENEDDDDENDTEVDIGLKEPGYNSGSTAVLALLKGNQLYVANVGDSRCLVCREGVAVGMSEDHKPEDKIEFERIVKAGGKVYDERINSGLNLSRAFGDFSYKQNKELSDKEQMVIALPDVHQLTIEPGKDEFMVLACDGIWNVKSNQEVIDILRPKVMACDNNEKLSKIAEELLDECLGRSCYSSRGNDNMTLIIVKFKQSNKRSSSPSASSSKRTKTEESECSTTASTTS